MKEVFEKVGAWHPDKVADRIAGALVDIAYERSGGIAVGNPRIAVECLLGHGEALVIVETDADIGVRDVTDTVQRLSGIEHTTVRIVPQDAHLAANQREGLRCGDNGVFRGCPVTDLQRELAALVRRLDGKFGSDMKAVMQDDRLIVCQSNARIDEVFHCIDDVAIGLGNARIVQRLLLNPAQIFINPLGYWTGGSDVDCGAVNRKLGSDMGAAVTGGGLHGKDLSKSDVSVNIVCHKLAQFYEQNVTASCAIGDKLVKFCYENGSYALISYDKVVADARNYIIKNYDGKFEKFAEYGLI